MSGEVFFVAGETSGDLHAAGVAAELRRRRPDLTLTGVGGVRMAAEGVILLERAERMAVMGFAEVLRHVPRHYALLRAIRSRLRGGQVRLLVLIDYPGFNMKVARAAQAARVPVLYYVTPQVWAWGRGRLTELARTVTRAAVILPFEEQLLREHGVDATFVGHPLLDRARALPDRAAARRALRLPPDGPVLALFPGSRAQEIARHLDAFVATARIVESRVRGLRVVICAAPGIPLDGQTSGYPVVRGPSFTVLRAADAALCKSGTTTLEAAVADCPLAVVYRTSWWTYALAKRFVKIPRIGLVNIVAGREVAPEFVQDAVQPERIAAALVPLLSRESPTRRAMLADLADVRRQLGEAGAASRVASMALELLG
ncbi:MAG: lipid-A-disaccharide synthase [Gemmatimonadaceae bacterium]